MTENVFSKHEKESPNGTFDEIKEANKVAGLIDKAAVHPGAFPDSEALKALSCEIWTMAPNDMASVLFHMQTHDSYPHFDPKMVDEQNPIILYQTKDSRAVFVDLTQKPNCPESTQK